MSRGLRSHKITNSLHNEGKQIRLEKGFYKSYLFSIHITVNVLLKRVEMATSNGSR